MTYSYDPTQIGIDGKDKLRFVLADTAVEGGAETCALSDEEYEALLRQANGEGGGFPRARYRCLEAIMMKFAYEVDFSADGMSLSLSKRYDRWKEMWLQAQTETAHISANPEALGKNRLDGGHYFYAGMHDNPRAELSPSPFHDV